MIKGTIVAKYLIECGVLLCVLYIFRCVSSQCPIELDKCINPSTVTCTHARYRTMDGSCNNPRYPTLGMAGTTYKRLLPAKYSDGKSSIRLSKSGKPLPSPRLLSYKVFGREVVSDPKRTLLTMQWGQLVTHDITLHLQSKFHGESPLTEKIQKCCNESGRFEYQNTSLKCDPLAVPPDDPFFKRFECLIYFRSLTDGDIHCPGAESTTPADHPSGVTHYLDLSFVYGDSRNQSQQLRVSKKGLLKATERTGHEWPPYSQYQNDQESLLYDLGDKRANQHPDLTSMQIIFLREHNRIALKLAGLNQDWADETLFEEARRINIAQFQHITYYEWAKNLFSIDKLRAHEIIFNTKPEEFVSDYDPCVDPRSIESFIHSVFRYFHTQIMGVLFLVSESRSFYEPAFTLSSVKNKPDFLEDECRLDSVVRGLSTQHAKLADTNFDIEAAEDFNQGRPKDLRSTDLQRDRDHGLPPYNDFLEFCNLGRAKSWKDFLKYIPEEHVKRLYSIYESFEDVDLSVGGALERHVPRSLVGPTFLCVSLIQLKNLRKGDRYFFENREQPYPFSEDQLKEIRKSSAARLLCDNTNIERMQPQAFRRISINNELELCSNLPEVDLRKWHVNNPK